MYRALGDEREKKTMERKERLRKTDNCVCVCAWMRRKRERERVYRSFGRTASPSFFLFDVFLSPPFFVSWLPVSLQVAGEKFSEKRETHLFRHHNLLLFNSITQIGTGYILSHKKTLTLLRPFSKCVRCQKNGKQKF